MSALPDLPISSRTAPCCLCGQRSFEVLSTQDRRGDDLATVICTTCGLISHESIPADDELTDYYRASYRQEYHRTFRPSPHHVLRAWQLGGHLVQKLAPFLKPGERVFEVGAGIGATVKQFELAGMQASGVEPHDGYREYGRGSLHAALDAGVLDEVQTTPWYDLIVLHHVLEHLPHPLRALEQVRRMLRLGGRVYVEVPNVAGPHAAPGKQFHYAHVYNFTPATLTSLATAAGLAVKEVLSAGKENIGLLLVADSRAHAAVDFSSNYDDARAALARHSALSYYARPQYLFQRVQRFVAQATDRVAPNQRLQPVLQRCATRRGSTITARAA